MWSQGDHLGRGDLKMVEFPGYVAASHFRIQAKEKKIGGDVVIPVKNTLTAEVDDIGEGVGG